MRLRKIRIKNYRSCKDVEILLDSMHALVGANNAGKSSILRALDFLFNPSTKKIDEESFWNKVTSEKIWIEAIFENLTEDERESLRAYLKEDGSFHMARSAIINGEGGDEEGKISIGQHYCKPIPKHDWLREDIINQKMITEWLSDPDQLSVAGISFLEFAGKKKLRVGEWKEKAKEFAAKYLPPEDLIETWIDNPKGYAGVLKSSLPHFIFVPAVKEASDEAKVTKSSPFGKLIYEILNNITREQMEEIDKSMAKLRERLNRVGGEERFPAISETEDRLKKIISMYMPCDLEMEFEPPTIEVLLTSPKILVDDGFKNTIENKGHGLQRAFIFSVLQCYSELVTGSGQDKKRSMLFGVEEPELYMHPQAQRNIRKVFQDIAGNGNDQVIFSTHSALLVDVAHFDEIIRVEASRVAVGSDQTVCTKVWQLPVQKMIDDLKARHPSANPTPGSMRELYSHAYHPTRSEGFFAKKVILVEGPTEAYSLPIYAEFLDIHLDRENIGIVECGGKGQMDRLYRIFNELGIACYMLIDYDKDNTDGDIIDKSKELLKLVGVEIDPPEEVYIGSAIACFPRKWETDVNAEIEGVDRLTAEARSALGLSNDTGKPLIARYIARKITSEDTPYVPPTIKKILEAAINVERTGSCLACGD